MNEILKRVFKEGSVNIQVFHNSFKSDSSHYMKLIEETTKALYEQGLTPAQIKGFFEFGMTICNLIHPNHQ